MTKREREMKRKIKNGLSPTPSTFPQVSGSQLGVMELPGADGKFFFLSMATKCMLENQYQHAFCDYPFQRKNSVIGIHEPLGTGCMVFLPIVVRMQVSSE